MPREVSKQLVCPACGVVIADATYTRWPGNLVLVSAEGHLLQPESVADQLRRARSDGSPDRVEFLERHIGELVYDLRCRNGHTVLRTMPQVVRAVRRARGRWADPG